MVDLVVDAFGSGGGFAVAFTLPVTVMVGTTMAFLFYGKEM